MSDYLPRRIVILGTGGTIAGRSHDAAAGRDTHYNAAQLSAVELMRSLPHAAHITRGLLVEVHQLAQLDSKDMNDAAWHALALACRAHQSRAEVAAIVITHGTDTLEETAWFLHNTIAPTTCPIVLTAAMRTPDALGADGAANLRDALRYASSPSAWQRSAWGQHVVCVLAGQIHSAAAVQKVHPLQLAAFSSFDSGCLGWVEDGHIRWSQPLAIDAASQSNLGQNPPLRCPGSEPNTSYGGILFYPQGDALVPEPPRNAAAERLSPTYLAVQAAIAPQASPLGFDVDANLQAMPLSHAQQSHTHLQQVSSNPSQLYLDYPEPSLARHMRTRELPASAHWPWVEVVHSHAGARAQTIDALVNAGVRGLVIAGTGNATVHRALLEAIARAMGAGVAVRRCSRCPQGVALNDTQTPQGSFAAFSLGSAPHRVPSAQTAVVKKKQPALNPELFPTLTPQPAPERMPVLPLSPMKARISLMLHLMAKNIENT